MAQFVLLLHENPATFAQMSAEEMQKIIEEYTAWGTRMRERGLVRRSAKLEDAAGRVLKGSVVTDGPYTEANEIIGGLFEIEAADYDGAVEIARGCPHTKYGTLEIRRIEISH